MTKYPPAATIELLGNVKSTPSTNFQPAKLIGFTPLLYSSIYSSLLLPETGSYISSLITMSHDFNPAGPFASPGVKAPSARHVFAPSGYRPLETPFAWASNR